MKKLTILLFALSAVTSVIHAQDIVFVPLPYGIEDNYWEETTTHQYGRSGDTTPYDLLIAPDGDFIAMARAQSFVSSGFLAIYKTAADGQAFDYDFGFGGVVLWPPVVLDALDKGAMAFDSQGRIIVAAVNNGQLTLVRLTAGGDLDITFDDDGFRNYTFDFTLEFVHDLIVDITAGDAVYPIGLLEQSGDRDGVIFRFDAAGYLDTNFGAGGIQRVNTGPDDAIYAGALDESHLTVVGKSASDSLMARYEKVTGMLDTAFSGGGVQIIDYGSGTPDALNDILYTQDGDFVSVGAANADVIVLSFEPDGSADLNFNADGITTLNLSSWGSSNDPVTVAAHAVDEDLAGNLWVAGVARKPVDAWHNPITWLLKPDGTENHAINHSLYVQRYPSLPEIVAVKALDNGGLAYLGRSIVADNHSGAFLHITEPTVNLLVNGGFEAVRPNGKPIGWTLKNPSGDLAVCDPLLMPRTSYSGKCSFRFKGNTGEASVLSQTIHAQPGLPLAVAGDKISYGFVFAKRGHAVFKLKVTYTDGRTKVFKVDIPGAMPSYFTAYLPKFKVNRDVSKISIIFRGLSKPGKLYLDSTTLMVVSTPSATQQAATLSMPLSPLPPAP